MKPVAENDGNLPNSDCINNFKKKNMLYIFTYYNNNKMILYADYFIIEIGILRWLSL